MEKIEEWNECVDIDWWREGRTQLNKVIRKYNKWIDKHTENNVKTYKLLNKIDEHLEMRYSNQNGGSEWKDVLLKMKSVVESKMSFKVETEKLYCNPVTDFENRYINKFNIY